MARCLKKEYSVIQYAPSSQVLNRKVSLRVELGIDFYQSIKNHHEAGRYISNHLNVSSFPKVYLLKAELESIAVIILNKFEVRDFLEGFHNEKSMVVLVVPSDLLFHVAL